MLEDPESKATTALDDIVTTYGRDEAIASLEMLVRDIEARLDMLREGDPP